MTHPALLTLSALVDGELADDEAARVGAHLAACAQCAERYRQLAAVRDWARAGAFTPPPAGEWPRIARAIDVSAGRHRATRLRRLRRLARSWPALGAAAAAAAVALVAGTVALRHRRAPVPLRWVEVEAAAPALPAALDPAAAAMVRAALDTLDRARAELDRAAAAEPSDAVMRARSARAARDRAEFERLARRLGALGNPGAPGGGGGGS